MAHIWVSTSDLAQKLQQKLRFTTFGGGPARVLLERAPGLAACKKGAPNLLLALPLRGSGTAPPLTSSGALLCVKTGKVMSIPPQNN